MAACHYRLISLHASRAIESFIRKYVNLLFKRFIKQLKALPIELGKPSNLVADAGGVSSEANVNLCVEQKRSPSCLQYAGKSN